MSVRWFARRCGALMILAGAAACAREAPPPEPFRVVASVKQVMQAITVPASNAVFAAGGEPPADAGQWTAIENSALALAESGNLLLMNGRAVDREEWVAQVRSLIDASLEAARAARAHDLDKLLDAGDGIYSSCESCHQRYMPKAP